VAQYEGLPSVAGARVRARGWGWRHAGRTRRAVADLDFAIEPGERVLLLGPSGAGKSTLLHGLAGVLGGDEEGDQTGELLVDGRPPAATRGRTGLVLQDPDSQVVLARIGDDVAFGCENLGLPREEIWRRVGAALEAVGLGLPLDHPSSSLSGGQKQRLALAGALAMRPGLLLLDEPTANLDPDGVVEVRDAVARVLEDRTTTLVVVEHRVSIWLDLVDRVIVLDPDGGILADGPVQSVLLAEGERLAAAGVWVPGFPPVRPSRVPGSSTADATKPGSIQPATTLLSTRALGIGRGRRIAVDPGIDLVVDSGRATAITGVNGAGKSTLALTLGGLLRPASGSVEAGERLAQEIGPHPHAWRSRQLLTRIGTVFQNPEHQFLAATVRAELAIGPRALRLTDAETARRVDDLLVRLRLDGLAGANPFTLSGGEKRRLSVATVLATQPRLLVLDEPTFGQDSRTWQELVALLAELLEAGSSLVAVTHDADFIDALADVQLRLSPRFGHGAESGFQGATAAVVTR
jgi:energy-coupling factor transporter ATP-binding protein EcfA2